MSRNSVKINDLFTITPVNDFSVFAGFSCLHESDEDRDLDDFIRDDAERHHCDRIATTYILTEVENPTQPLAFATLQNDAIFVKPDKPLPGVDGYPYKSYPAVKIGRFGVHKALHSKQFGSMFLLGIKTLMLRENRTGCRYITVDARRDTKAEIDVAPFYAKNGFEKLVCRESTSSTTPMYFDLLSFQD